MHGGLGFDHQYFRPFLDPLADSAKLVFYDHLGHGRSDRPADFSDLTFARLSSDCDALATALGFVASNSCSRRACVIELSCRSMSLTMGGSRGTAGLTASTAAYSPFSARAAARLSLPRRIFGQSSVMTGWI